MKLTEVIFFKNTPLVDFMNTIHFKSNQDRDLFFLNGGHYPTMKFNTKFNFVRDRLTFKIDMDFELFSGYNYCTFKTEGAPRYYAFVGSYDYINDGVVTVHFIIDTVMTYTQGNKFEELQNITVEREHLPQSIYERDLYYLQTNSDILETTTKQYIKTKLHNFLNFYIVFTTSVDLSANLGTQNKPLLKTSSGSRYDNITSPLNLYVMHQNDFNNLMKYLSDFPWISQNITKALLVPFEFLDDNDFEDVKMHNDAIADLKKFKKDGKSVNYSMIDFGFTRTELIDIFQLNEKDLHLFRTDYMEIEMLSWDGQKVTINPCKLDSKIGLEIKVKTCIGYHNSVSMYPNNYDANGDDGDGEVSGGTFLNNALNYNDFDDIPILIDNYKLGQAQMSNRTNLSDSKQLSNRVNNIVNGQDMTTRFMDAVNVLSDVSPTAITGKLVDEYEYYRTQKAEMADMAISSPTITTQSHSNSFQIANDIWGVTLKFTCIDDVDKLRLKNYFSLFGFQIQKSGTSLHSIDSMSICNYIRFSGRWTLPNIDASLLEQLKVQCENGLRLWHDNGTPNPFNQDLIFNERVK